MRYLVQPRDRIFVNGYGCLYFAKKMGKNIDRNISKKLSSYYGILAMRQKLLDHVIATDAIKTSLKESFKKQQKQLKI